MLNPIIPENPPPDGEPQSPAAQNLAEYFYEISLPCPTDGIIYPPPRPRLSVTRQISLRLQREQRAAEQRERDWEQLKRNPPPEPLPPGAVEFEQLRLRREKKGANHAG